MPAPFLRVLLVLGATYAFSTYGCVTEPATQDRVVVLPKDSIKFERFIELASSLSADRIIVDAVTAYRRDMAPIVDKDMHTKTVTPTRIELVNHADNLVGTPVVLSFRNMRLEARQHLEARLSDVALMNDNPSPVLIRIVGDGLAHARGAGVDVIAERIVIENDHIRAFDAQGREIKVE